MLVQAGEPVEWRPLSLRFASLDFCGLIGGDSNEISFHIFRVCSPDFTIQVMEFIPLAPVPYCDFQSEEWQTHSETKYSTTTNPTSELHKLWYSSRTIDELNISIGVQLEP